MKKIFIIKDKKIRPLMVSERKWNKGGAFSANIDGNPAMIKHGGPVKEAFYSSFETEEEAKQFIADEKVKKKEPVYPHEGHPY